MATIRTLFAVGIFSCLISFAFHSSYSFESPPVLSKEFHDRYGALQREVQQALDAKEGDDRIAFVRELMDSERAELAVTIPRDCPIQPEDVVAIDVRYRGLESGDRFGRLYIGQWYHQQAIEEAKGLKAGYMKRLAGIKKTRNIANEVARFFHKNYGRSSTSFYPLEHVIPVHFFVQEAERLQVEVDDLSMQFNNSYAYACREVRNTGKWSRHASGAIDLNPAYNPIVSRTEKAKAENRTMADLSPTLLQDGYFEFEPLNGQPYLFGRDRIPSRYIHTESTFSVAYFTKHDWSWGGDWKSLKDYHHFSPGLE